MRVALHDADHTTFPNLALMKISAWHKMRGHDVQWFMPLAQYDAVFSSKVFSWTPESRYLPDTSHRGGTGRTLDTWLSQDIEHASPDYSIYPLFKASLGFTTRGCIRSCPWCIVPRKEGSIRPHAEVQEFLRKDSQDVVLMDNNILAHEHGIKQIEFIIDCGLRLDCNQGLDARLIAADDGLARLLSRVRWIRSIRLACDSLGQMPAVASAVSSIRRHGGKKYCFSCYVLVKEVPDALERVEFLRSLGVDSFAQPYRAPSSSESPPLELRRFARWVNHKAIFNAVPWSEYR